MMQGLWAVPYLIDVHGDTQQEAANALTLWAVGLIVGCTTWGYVADHVVKTRKGVVSIGAVVYALLWVLLAVAPAALPDGLVLLAMFWGGFFASTWIPAYAQLRDAVPPQAVATAIGTLNLFFWVGGAFYQHVSGLLLEAFSKESGRVSLAGYRTLFWGCLASVVLSVILAALSNERRPAASTAT
jgi:sugar phosphate permease